MPSHILQKRSIQCSRRINDVRIHVIDDGATDGTESVVARYLNTGRVISLRRPHSDRGPPPRNIALRASSVEIPACIARHD